MNDVVIFYRRGKSGNHYHAGGLACNALHTVAVLRAAGLSARVEAAESVDEIARILTAAPARRVVVEAVWVSPFGVRFLRQMHPLTRFTVRAHSKMGFLQVEPEAIPAIRELMADGAFASNNEEFAHSLAEAYEEPCRYLPNLYDRASSPRRAPGERDAYLRVASFGASRLLKMHPPAALAALQVARRLSRKLIFSANVDGTPGGDSVRRSVREVLRDEAELREVTWQDGETFRRTIAEQDLVLQLSATETFCMVAADAVASGVPVVGGPAISWLPPKYQAPIDDTAAVADVAVKVLHDSSWAAAKQRAALERHVERATRIWLDFLDPPKRRRWWWPW